MHSGADQNPLILGDAPRYAQPMHAASAPSFVAESLSAHSPAGEPPLADPSFAGILAKLAAPQNTAAQGPDAPWNDDGLDDDVATISYERALHAHARVPAQGFSPEPQPEPVQSSQTGNAETASGAAGSRIKNARFTIRLSEPECAQMRQRAAEAGMTVSAYLRSCTLEVESLRAQVKQTLAEMRNTAPKPAPPQAEVSTCVRRTFMARFHHWLRQFGRPRPTAIPLNPANPFAPARY